MIVGGEGGWQRCREAGRAGTHATTRQRAQPPPSPARPARAAPAMFAKLMPHLKVGAQKWMVLGPAGWFHSATRRWPTVGAAAMARRACVRAGRGCGGVGARCTPPCCYRACVHASACCYCSCAGGGAQGASEWSRPTTPARPPRLRGAPQLNYTSGACEPSRRAGLTAPHLAPAHLERVGQPAWHARAEGSDRGQHLQGKSGLRGERGKGRGGGEEALGGTAHRRSAHIANCLRVGVAPCVPYKRL